MLTFSHAINILYDLGHIELFQRGIKPLLKLVYVLRKSRNLMPECPNNIEFSCRSFTSYKSKTS